MRREHTSGSIARDRSATLAGLPTPHEMLIHIGYHKTGSSWLQRHLFSRKAGAGFTAFDKGRDGPINRLIVTPNALDFDPHATHSGFMALADRATAKGLTPVVSSERLSGHPLTGGRDSKELAERLAVVFPDGLVLIVIREQREMLLSTYRQYVKAGGAWSLPQFLDPPVDTRTRVPLSDPIHFAYHRLIRTYHRLFGDDRVLVLPYELLRADPGRFVTAIARFAGATLPPGFVDSLPVDARPNLSPSRAATRIKRAVNRLAARSDLNPAPLFDAPRLEAFARRREGLVDHLIPAALATRLERRDRERVADAVGDRFDASNRATSDACGLDLATLGYSVGGRAPVRDREVVT
jgi:Sulfotransferase family